MCVDELTHLSKTFGAPPITRNLITMATTVKKASTAVLLRKAVGRERERGKDSRNDFKSN